jgi:hypothetical protein
MGRNKRSGLVVVFALALTLVSITHARTIYVDVNAPADFNTIQAAIDDANTGDIIVIRPGTYTGPGNRDLAIYGRSIVVRSVDPNEPNIVGATVIDCQGTAAESHRGFTLNTPGSVLEGLTIINGYTREGGGAIYASGNSVTIRSCRLINNHASGGGAVHAGALTLMNCLIARNSISGATWYWGGGGGVHCGGEEGLVTIYGCTIVDNTATGGEGDPPLAGGLYAGAHNTIIDHCTILGNKAGNGGGVFSAGLNCTISNCIMRSNAASVGAQLNATGVLSVSYSDIEGGWAGQGNIDSDPLFVDASSGNYHLAMGSPCTEAGDPQYVPDRRQLDSDNEPRVMGAATDMGVDEFPAAPAPVLNVYPKQLIFHADCNGLAPEPQELHIAGAGYVPLVSSLTEDCSWLGSGQPDPPSADGSRTVVLSVSAAKLSPGRYDTQITITADRAPNSPQTVAVSLYIREGPALHVPQVYQTIQSAIEASRDGDVVIVQKGTCTGLGNRDIDFLGKAITVRSVDPNDASVVAATIIDCAATETDRHRGFLFCSREGPNSVLSGLTITHGQALTGAGICVLDASPTILHCRIVDNACIARVSAVPDESVTLKAGGGVYVENGSPHIEKCLIEGNQCYRLQAKGGGIYCYDANVVIKDCTIKTNRTYTSGAGVHAEVCKDITLSGCTIIDNQASVLGGGGIYLTSCKGAISHCLIVRNQSDRDGGAMFIEKSETLIQNCTIAENTAKEHAGGVDFSVGQLSMVNTILWNNAASAGSQIAFYAWTGWADSRSVWIAGTVTIGHCDIEGGQSKVCIYGDARCLLLTWDAGNIDGDPLFADKSVEDYHLKSQAGRWDPNSKEWVLDMITSPCIDAGDPNLPVGDEPEPNGGRINMGAYGGTAEASKSYVGQPAAKLE